MTSWRWTAAAALAALVASLAGCSSPHPPAHRTTTTTTTPTTTTSPAPPTTTTPATPAGRIGTDPLATVTLDLVEPATDTQPARDLPTMVWYPSVPQPAGGFPLIVFSRGYDIGLAPYDGLLELWASAGFVVAAPTFPFTDPTQTAQVDENDIVHHPGDLHYVIGALLALDDQAGNSLTGRIDANEIGLAGHSDGADVTLALAADSCCQDLRVKAAAVLSGAELASFGGSYDTGPIVPMLVAQGSADTINYPVCSEQLYDAARPPKYYMDLIGDGHNPPYEQGGPVQNAIARAVVDFFEGELTGDAGALAALVPDGSIAGSTQITAGAAAPAASGSCPGAPG